MCRTLYITPRRFVVGAVLAGLAMPVSAASDVALADMDRWRMLEAEQLDEVRGGFEMPDLGLKLSFGLQQSILINGELVSRTVLNLQQVQATIANQVEAARADVISTTAGISAQVQAQVAEQLRAVGLQTTPVTTVTHTGASQPVQGQSASVAQQVAGAPSSVSTATVSQPVVAAPSAGSSTTSVSTAPTHSCGCSFYERFDTNGNVGYARCCTIQRAGHYTRRRRGVHPGCRRTKWRRQLGWYHVCRWQQFVGDDYSPKYARQPAYSGAH